MVSMVAIEVGRKCVKLSGRDAGAEVTITQVVDKNFVKVKDAKGKEGRVNVKHLEPV